MTASTAISERPVPAGADELPLVLIIEDNKDVAHYICSCLEADYRLETAYNGREGIDKAIELIPDLIISDVMMPEKDGFEVCDILKNDERTSHIPIVLLTARADVESRIAGLRRGADAYLAKPFHQEELKVRLKELIELRKALQKRYAGLRPPAPTDDHLLKQEDAFLQGLRQELEANLSDEQFGIPELCKAIGVSRTQLHRKLKALTGHSASHYIRAVRLQCARELIESTDLTISQVALEVGISSLPYFSRIFSEHFGKTPTQIRGH